MAPFSELTSKEKFLEVLRWILLLPCSLLAGVAARLFFIILFSYRNCGGIDRFINPVPLSVSDSPLFESLDNIGYFVIINAAYGIVTVFVAHKIAPRHKIYGSALISSLWFVLFAIALIGTISSITKFQDLIAIVISTLASTISFIWIYSSSRQSALSNHID